MLYVFSQALLVLECALLLAYFGIFFPPRFPPMATRAAIALSSAACALSVDAFDLVCRRVCGANAVVTFLWPLCFCAAVSLLLYRCRFLQTLAFAALYYAVLFALQYLGRCALALLNPPLLFDYGWPYHLLRFAPLCLYLAAYRICANKASQERGHTMRRRSLISLLCAAALALSCMLWAQPESLTAAISGSLQILFVAFSFFLLYRLDLARDSEHVRQFSELRGRLLQQNLKDAQRIQNWEALKRHDLLNHIAAIKAAAAQQDWKTVCAYLADLDGEDLPSVAYTGNQTANALLNRAHARALEEGIAFTAYVYIPPDLPVRPIDLCQILGNLLDNATEACAAVREPERRKVSVKIGSKNDFLAIRVSNTVNENPLLQNPLLVSTKQGPGHGMGLASVRTAMRQYRGVLDYDFYGGAFHALVTLCFTKEKP